MLSIRAEVLCNDRICQVSHEAMIGSIRIAKITFWRWPSTVVILKLNISNCIVHCACVLVVARWCHKSDFARACKVSPLLTEMCTQLITLKNRGRR